MALDLGKLLAENMSAQNGHHEKIEYIPLDRLDGDERNFYELSAIDQLAANIELIGLQQPIRVRECGGRFRIVSGHRRHAAIKKLVAEGNKDFERVACIVETVECSPAMQELRLIYANSDTRKMSSADLARQAERVEALLYQLKEEGYEFPGRMRDHVAQACQTTKSKLSRLKVITQRLHKNLVVHWQDGRINDAVAYAIAQEDERVQNALWARYGSEPRTWTLDITLRKLDELKQPNEATEKIKTPSNAQQACSDYLAQRVAEDVDFVKFIQNRGFKYFLKHAAGITRQTGIKGMKDQIGFLHKSHWGELDDRWETMPNGLTIKRVGRDIRRSWTEVWDAMAVEALRRCLVAQIENEIENPEPVGQLVFNGWMPGGTNPSNPCDAVAVFDLGGRAIKRIVRWTGADWKFEQGGAKIEMPVLKWMALPPDEEDA